MGLKNKFFAFFQTEEQFVRFALKYIKEHPAMLGKHDEDLRHFSRVFQSDICSMALGRMGFREKRFEQFDEQMTGVVKDYLALWTEDEKVDKDMVYSRECFERELKQYCGKKYVPWEERNR